MSTTKKIIDAVAEGNTSVANQAFAKAIKEKVDTILDIKKVAITSEIYNKATAAK